MGNYSQLSISGAATDLDLTVLILDLTVIILIYYYIKKHLGELGILLWKASLSLVFTCRKNRKNR